MEVLAFLKSVIWEILWLTLPIVVSRCCRKFRLYKKKFYYDIRKCLLSLEEAKDMTISKKKEVVYGVIVKFLNDYKFYFSKKEIKQLERFHHILLNDPSSDTLCLLRIELVMILNRKLCNDTKNT